MERPYTRKENLQTRIANVYLYIMYYRRKIALALLQTFGETMGKTKFQKLLMLFVNTQEKPDYHFVPYKYGCFSFQAMADLSTMQKYQQLTISNAGITKTDPTDYIAALKENDRRELSQLYTQHKSKDYSDLIKYTYRTHPYFAIHSEIADRFLTKEEVAVVERHKPVDTRTILYTIGYEGVTLEQYLNKLIAKDVKVLVDVRNNPMSMKYGFTKSQLLNACTSVGLQYVHFPDVGIISKQRKGLNEQQDYDELFAKYCKETLPETISTQQKILLLLREKSRIALTCFEANVCQCHRKHLAEAIVRLPDWNYDLIHL
jgi:uncharacterized protein (DUF488 family)